MKEIENLIRDAAKKIAHEAVARAFHAALKSLDDAPGETPRPKTVTKRERIVTLAKKHPDWSDSDIAEQAGVTRDHVSVTKSLARKNGDLPPSKHHAARKPKPRKRPGLVGIVAKSAAVRDAIDDAIRAGKTDAEVSREFGVYHGSIGFRRKTLNARTSVESPVAVVVPAESSAPVAEPKPVADTQVTEAA